MKTRLPFERLTEDAYCIFLDWVWEQDAIVLLWNSD